MLRKLIFTLLIVPIFSFAQNDSIDTSTITNENIEDIIVPLFLDIPEIHGGFRDMTPGKFIDTIPLSIENIKGGWRRVVSSGYYTPNGDATWEPNEVHGSIYFSENKVYYMTYPIRMHSYADYSIDNFDSVRVFNQKVLPDNLEQFSENPTLFTKDSLTTLFFDGEYYARQQMDHNIVLDLEQKTIRPEALIGNWDKTDTLSCCYGTTWWQIYPWDMPEELHISKTWANKIYKKQKIYMEIDGEFKPFFIAVLGEYEMEIEAGSWFKGEADRVVYHKRWE